MILNKTHELYFENNDVYQIESCLDKIIINENYHGIRILDLSLNTIKIIPLEKHFTTFGIYKKYDNKWVMIYAPNQNYLIFVNLETFSHYTIKPLNPLDDYLFGQNYYWENDTLIFEIENKKIFYQLDFESLSLKKISYKAVKILAPTFFDFWKACKAYNATTIYPSQQAFTFRKNRKLIGFYDYKNKNLILKKQAPKFFEEIYYHNQMFISFDAWNKNISIQNNHTLLDGADSYYCLRINNLNNGNLALLFTNKNDHKYCFIQIYEIHR